MGKSESNLMALEVEVKRLRDRIIDQQNIFDKRDCTYKEEITRLKTQLQEGNKIRKTYKEKDDQCQRFQDEVTSLRN